MSDYDVTYNPRYQRNKRWRESQNAFSRAGQGGNTTRNEMQPNALPITQSLIAWFDFSDLGVAAVKSDGDKIPSVFDRSGSGNHATQTTEAAKPQLKLAIKNGLAVARFDGVNHYLTTRPVWMQKTQTIFGVMKHNVEPAGLANAFGTILINTWGMWVDAGLLTLQAYTDGGAFFETQSGISVGVWYILCGVRRMTELHNYANDQSAGPTAITGTPVEAQSTIAVGAGQTTATYRLNGDLGEVLIYNEALNDSDRVLVLNYLNSKWSVY